MGKLSLIIQREYSSRVHKKSFIIMTFLSPIIFVGILFVPIWLSSLSNDEVREVSIVDYTNHYKPVFVDNENYKFTYYSDSTQTPSAASFQKDKDAPYAFVVITNDLLKDPKAITIYSEKQVTSEFKQYIDGSLERTLETEKLASFNVPGIEKMLEDAKIKLDISTIRLSEDGSETETSTESVMVIGMVCTMIIYMFLLLYGAQVMQGVMQEKTNRIVEVMVSSVKPFDLMMGKIIGIGLVGLTQILIWIFFIGGLALAAGAILSTFAGGADLAAGMGAETSDMSKFTDLQSLLGGINITELIIYFILYFIGGYILYASLFAAIGSAVDNESDTQQFMVPVTMLIIFALYAGIYSAENPDGPLAFWCSMIPFTSPIVMMVRIPFGVPFWQMALSLLILTASFIGTTWVSSRIYRIGILMYGKKPSYKEMIKWIKYKN